MTMYEEMCTYSGKMLKPLEIRPEDISLKDISHALSLLCRGSGHLRCFYSVGQHCINCAREAGARGWGRRLVLACLVHDASEAYISDIIRPVKQHLAGYMEIEEKILSAVYEHFGLGDLSEEEYKMIRRIDDEMLENEIPLLMSRPGNGIPAKLYSEPDFSQRDMEQVEKEYAALARELTGREE